MRRAARIAYNAFDVPMVSGYFYDIQQPYADIGLIGEHLLKTGHIKNLYQALNGSSQTRKDLTALLSKGPSHGMVP